MPRLISNKLTFYKNINDLTPPLFGFFYCKIKTSFDAYIGLLPIRSKLGIEFPLGEWEGWYFSEELKFSKENGYHITVLKGYEFNRKSDVFDKYIESIYNIK